MNEGRPDDEDDVTQVDVRPMRGRRRIVLKDRTEASSATEPGQPRSPAAVGSLTDARLAPDSAREVLVRETAERRKVDSTRPVGEQRPAGRPVLVHIAFVRSTAVDLSARCVAADVVHLSGQAQTDGQLMLAVDNVVWRLDVRADHTAERVARRWKRSLNRAYAVEIQADRTGVTVFFRRPVLNDTR